LIFAQQRYKHLFEEKNIFQKKFILPEINPVITPCEGYTQGLPE
jgi:hypothetical protein